MHRSPTNISDARLPGFADLLGEGVPGPVRAVYDTAGTSVESLAIIQATWTPGRRLIARYRIEGSGGDLAGRRDLVATLGWIPDAAGVVEGPDGAVGVWVVPQDPLLPGLASALDVPTVARLLDDLGAEAPVSGSRLRAYRPARRAVVEVSAGSASIFLKVVPPSEVDELHERHRYLTDFLPVPDSLGVARELGIVVMPALAGTDLRSVLRAGGAPPAPGDIAALISNLPAPGDHWVTRSPIENLPAIVNLLTHLLPEEEERLVRLVDHIGDDGVEPSVPVHGDFHEAQIMMNGGRPAGLIDVDTFGWGRPGDDPANMLGHLHLLAPGCESASSVIDLAAGLNRHWDHLVDPVDLRRRTAAVVLGLATGPFRVQRPMWPEETRQRIDVAEQWVESALRVDEKSLIPTSAVSHTGTR